MTDARSQAKVVGTGALLGFGFGLVLLGHFFDYEGLVRQWYGIPFGLLAASALVGAGTAWMLLHLSRSIVFGAVIGGLAALVVINVLFGGDGFSVYRYAAVTTGAMALLGATVGASLGWLHDELGSL